MPMTTMCADRLVGRQEVAESEHLLHDLVSGQVPLNAFQTAGAEDAAHAAADLSADADRTSPTLSHQDTLDPPAIATGDHQFVGPVGRTSMKGDAGAEDGPLDASR